MTVLHLAPRFDENSGGDGSYAYHLASACSLQGCNIFVLTIRGGEFVLFELSNLSQSTAATGDMTVHNLGAVGNDLLRTNYYSMAAGQAIRRAIASVSPDVIHVHGIHQYFTLAAIAPLRAFQGPVLYTVHDYKLLCGNAGFFSDASGLPCVRCLEGRYVPAVFERCKRGSILASFAASIQMGLWSWWRGLESFDAIHCGSEFATNLLSTNRAIAERIVKMRFPVIREQSRSFEQEEPPDVSVVYLGRMVPHKGPTVFAESAREMQVPVRLYGDGPLKEEAARILGGKTNVRFAGWVGQEVLDREVREGSIVVLPYLAMETFCYAALDSMARGCCVVASARGAIPELICDGVDGLLVQNPTSEEFRRVVSELLKDRSRVLSLGAKARQSVRRVPPLAAHAREMITFYDTLAARGKVRQGS